MSLPQLSSCCCGCTLRTGTLIILWIYLVSMYLQVFVILSIALLPWVKEMEPDSDKSPSKAWASTLEITAPRIADLILGIISIFASSIGLYGTYKKLHLYLTPFLAWQMVYVIIQAVLQLIANFCVAVIIGAIICFLIFFYLWLVVFSYYRVLKESNHQLQALP